MSVPEQQAPSKPGLVHFTRGCILGCLLPIVILFVVGWIALFIINHPRLNAAHAVRVDVTLRGEEKPSTNYLGAITNAVQVRALLSVLSRSSAGMDHKCGEVGWFLITYDNRKTRRINFLPGHDTDYYEYRTGTGVRAMDRGEFSRALHTSGINTNVFPSLDQ